MIDVSFLIGNLNKEHGGAQQLLYDLCRHLPAAEFDLTVYYMFGEGTFQPDLEAAGARVVALEANSNYDPRAFARFVRALRTERPDILHTNSPISGAWGRVAGRLVGVPHLLSVQHTVHDSRRPLARAVDDATLPLADAVVGVSEAVTSSFAPWERSLLDCTGARVETIRNGIDVAAIEAACQDADADVLDPYPVEPTDRIIGTVGRHIEAKGYHYLIDAMVPVTREHPDAKLLMVGDGPERGALERRVKHHALDDAVVFAGEQASVPPFLAQFSLGVFSSLHEGLPLSPIETMAAGVPIIGTDIPPFRRLLGNGEAGVLVPSRDSDALAEAIITLFSEPDERRQLGEQGHHRARHEFSISNTADQYVEIYAEMATGNRED